MLTVERWMLKMKRNKQFPAIVLLVAAAGVRAFAAGPDNSALDALIGKAGKNPDGMAVSELVELVKLGHDAGRPNAVSVAVRAYFSKHQDLDPRMLLLGAENAELTGDYRAAVVRYKQYLRTAPGTAESSDVAARLYHLLLDTMNAGDELFQFMGDTDGRFRGSVAAKRYDTWFVDTAGGKGAYVPLAKWLGIVLADQGPLAFEQLYFWQHLDWLISSSQQAVPGQYEALPSLRKLAPLVRDPARSRKLSFLAANMAFKAAAAGKDVEGMDKEFESLFAAARMYVEASPTDETLRFIYTVIGPYHWEDPYRMSGLVAKKVFLPYAMARLDDPNRIKFLDWENGNFKARCATAEDWCQLAVKYPVAFKGSEGAASLPLSYFSTNAADYKVMAQALGGIANPSASLMISLGAGDDLPACARRLFLQESWYQPPVDVFRTYSEVASWSLSLPRPADKPLAPQYREKSLQWVGAELVCKTPLALLVPDAARVHAQSAFANPLAKDGDKEAVAQQLHLLDWVPFTEAQRKLVYGPAYNEFKGWAKEIRNDLARAIRNPKTEADSLAALKARESQIQPIEDAFTQLMASPGEPAKGPDVLCQNLARAVLAVNQKNGEAYLAAARAVYPLVKDYAAKRTPFGRVILQYLVEQTGKDFDLFDFQREVLADQLASSGRLADLGLVVNTIAGNGKRWELGGYPANAKDKSLKLSAIFGDEVVRRLARNDYIPQYLEWFRAARSGGNWRDQESGAAVIEKLIALDQPANTGWRPNAFSAQQYAAMIRMEFNSLQAKYPPESYFDDMFVAAIATRGVDTGYWRISRDEKKKLVNATAKHLQAQPTLPLGYTPGLPVYDRATYAELMQRALGADEAVCNAMLVQLAGYYGTTRWDGESLGRHILWTVGDVTTPAGRKTYFETLGSSLDRLATTPAKLDPPHLGGIAKLGLAGAFTPAELEVFVKVLTTASPLRWSGGEGYESLVTLVTDGLVAQKRYADLLRLAPELMRVTRDTRSGGGYAALQKAATTIAEAGAPDAGAALISMMMQMPGFDLPGEGKNMLAAIRAKALSSLGAMILVEKNDPRYPLFQAQAEFQAGSLEAAWAHYDDRSELLLASVKDLDLGFVIWVIGKYTDAGEFATADATAQKVISWVDSLAQGVDPEVKAHLLVSYADIAFAQKEYPRARAQFERIALAKEFDGTLHKQVAALRVAEVDRLTRSYDRAIEQLEKLALKGDKFMKGECFYQLALIRFDQEQYPETRDFLDKAFNVDPAHVNARILEGKLYLKMKKLVEATSVKVGISSEQKTLVPGRPLKIELNDRNLAVVGKASSIEVRIWTTHGDEETVSLTPFGDSRTKFEASVPTALGAVQQGDRVLQVFGDDEIRYDFSEKFKQANAISGATAEGIRVISDAQLSASSGRILTQEERERREIETLIRASQEAAGTQPSTAVALSTVRAENEIKPGNSIQVRLTDLDMNISSNRDVAKIRVSSTSGDVIERFDLVETQPYSGVFEGEVPTRSAPATAFASDSDEGCLPNMAISGGDYKGWTARPDTVRPKWFTVDLNEKISLGQMTIMADVPGRRCGKMLIQTSPNGRDYTTVGSWPVGVGAWDGSPQAEVVRLAGQSSPLTSCEQIKSYLDFGYAVKGAEKSIVSLDRPGLSWDASAGGVADKVGLRMDGADSWYIAHVSSAFWVERREGYVFQVEPQGSSSNVVYFMEVDGVPAVVNIDKGVVEFKGSLVKGAHRLDVYICAQRKEGPKFEILQNIPTPPYMAKCPESMFSVTNNPALRAAVSFVPSPVTADSNGVFTVGFTNVSARAIRLWMIEFETDAPAIRKIVLKDSQGVEKLPVKDDLVKLRNNQQLELVPGDTISITYDDEQALSKDRRSSQSTLRATFRNAALSASFTESRVSGVSRTETYIPIRRFKPDDVISVFINDPDEDVSDKPDRVKFTVRASSGKPVTLDALETESHSGVFIGKVFPVSGSSAKPSDVRVEKGDDLILTYTDRENTDPGIGWDRTYTVEQVVETTPELRVYSAESRAMTTNELAAIPARTGSPKDEVIPSTMTVTLSRPQKAEPVRKVPGIINIPLVVEVTYPTIAQSPVSKATLYVQTSSGLAMASREAATDSFETNIPGTLMFQVPTCDASVPAPPPGYRDILVRGNPVAMPALDDGRFTFVIPTRLGSVTNKATEGRDEKPALKVKGGDEVFFGFPYQAADSNVHWLVSSVTLNADSFFDVMDGKYREPVESAFVGDALNFRVIDPMMDTTDAKDSLSIEIRTAGGARRTVALSESFEHSGIFKGSTRLSMRVAQASNETPQSVAVNLGEVVTASYTRPGSGAALVRSVQVHKGADGSVASFTKRFKDPEIAVQTQFTVAEAYFEMAKTHRELGQDVLARREIAHGRKLLNEAIHDFPNTEARAHADYLLAELSLEFGNEALNEDEKKRHYAEAVVRFTEVVANYPDSPYSPKAQFKKGLVYEKLGEIDKACEEYVKLSYRYPDNELIAETIARIGQYFLAKGKTLADKIAVEKDLVEKEKLTRQSYDLFKTAAQVFGRLVTRFPEHKLAGKTAVLSAQCYIRANDLPRAIAGFTKIIDDKKAEPELIAESLYWCGDTYMKLKETQSAYKMFKRITWDYPESTWAKYARGRLTEEVMSRIEAKDTINTGTR